MATVLHEHVRLEHENAIAIITIAHPPVNAINSAVIAGIRQALEQCNEDDSCRAVVITGDGEKCFAAGADVTEFDSEGSDLIRAGQGLTDEIEALHLPVIAAINGVCFGGGCELALACDIRIASAAARFGQPEINLGIIPGWGGTQRLPRLVGRGIAMELLLTGEPIDAQRALQIGLVSAVIDPQQLRTVAMQSAEKIAAQAPIAVRATKRAVLEGIDRHLSDGLDVERGEFSRVFRTEDAREGIAAFLEKRPAKWQGK